MVPRNINRILILMPKRSLCFRRERYTKNKQNIYQARTIHINRPCLSDFFPYAPNPNPSNQPLSCAVAAYTILLHTRYSSTSYFNAAGFRLHAKKTFQYVHSGIHQVFVPHKYACFPPKVPAAAVI